MIIKDLLILLILCIWMFEDPFSVLTFDSHRFFLIIVNDASWVTWVFLLKANSDVKAVGS